MTTNTVFQLRRNSVSGTRPTTTTVAPGELAINTTDGILFSANSTVIFEIGANNTNVRVTGNATINSIIANGSQGSAGQVLTTNGTGIYWSSAGVNTAASYTWTNTHTYNSNVRFNAGVIANSSVGTAGQVLHSNGSSVYWDTANSGLSQVVTQQFTANGTANSFLVTGGYFPNAIEVYVGGVKQVPGTDVTLTSGSTVNFAVPPLNGQIVDVFGYKAANNLQSISAIVSQQFTANGTTNTFTITPGYIPNAIEVYVAGVKRVPVTDVDISSGATITFTTAPLNGQTVDVFGYRSVGAVAPYIDVAGGVMTGNLTFNNGAVIIANGSFGTNGQVLTSNGSSMYWSSSSSGPRVTSITTATTITPTGDTADQYNVTALASGATVAAPSGTPVDGQRLILRFKDNGTGRALTWTTSSGAYRAVGVTLPTTTVATKTTYVGCIYNTADTFWDVIAAVTQA
jgi:hypothetical protein